MVHASGIIEAMIKVCRAKMLPDEVLAPLVKGEHGLQIDNPGPF
jgi:hypothetical protein